MHLNILTYNIRGEMWTENSTIALKSIIENYEVDIICLQEVVRKFNEKKERKGPRILKDLKKELDEEFGVLDFLPVQSATRSVGNAILYNKEKFQPVGQEYAKKFPKFSQRSGIEEFASMFLLPSRRVAMSEKFNFNNHKLIVYNVHLDYFGGDARRIYQISQFFKLWGMQRLEPGVIEILAGDFNTWAPLKFHQIYKIFSILDRFLKRKGFRETTGDIEWTQIFDRTEADRAESRGVKDYSSVENIITRGDSTFKQKLDHVWVRGDVEVISAERLDVKLSDHYPILVKLNIEEQKNAQN